ncbi:hypothetical protein CALCODRAFT_326070 [Calocera cornea HHB12733]|uniref:Uncharacterized protein n=1 Tax=Calocera cornea HHB12733 TaxID=1353952 RepID=A0A165JFX0_9BASI|nr:hypothetical protein CALCODRAFT_326070 [Calocera cornea HHB12733]
MPQLIFEVSSLRMKACRSAYTPSSGLRHIGCLRLGWSRSQRPMVKRDFRTHTDYLFDVKSGIVQMIHLASKTANALSGIQEVEAANNILETAAKMEGQLKNMEFRRAAEPQKCAEALTAYYCERMESAAQANNESVAFFMMQQSMGEPTFAISFPIPLLSCEDETRLSLLPLSDVRHARASARSYSLAPANRSSFWRPKSSISARKS